MSVFVWVMVGVASWHLAVLVPDRFYGGIIGALIAAVAGALRCSGYLLPFPGVPTARARPGLPRSRLWPILPDRSLPCSERTCTGLAGSGTGGDPRRSRHVRALAALGELVRGRGTIDSPGQTDAPNAYSDVRRGDKLLPVRSELERARSRPSQIARLAQDASVIGASDNAVVRRPDPRPTGSGRWRCDQGVCEAMLLDVILPLMLVLANGVFVAAEFAVVRVRPTQVEELERSGRPGASSVRHAVGHVDAYLAACQLGITLASIGLGVIGKPAFEALLQPLFGGAASALGTALAATLAFALITLPARGGG